ncbi:MAG: S8 family serine peptidase [Sphingopyxis sp.]|nr:S8 family serine peptidase [Sphingopyxis sp.]
MKMRLLALLAGLLLVLPGLHAAAAQMDATASHADDATAGGEILLLLKLPPPHFRPGSDYAGSYGGEAGRAARHRIARRIARDHGLQIVDDWPMPLLSLDCFVLSVPSGRSPAEIAARLASLPEVHISQPVNRFTAQGTTHGNSDPLYPAQPAAHQWQLANLHRIADGKGVRVAIIDSQIARSHPDLAGQFIFLKNFAPAAATRAEHHGTAVAGIIAAHANNGIGIVGVAPRARLMGLRACWQTGAARPGETTVCNSFSLAKAIYFAIENKADILNLSLSGPPDPLLVQLLNVAQARGIVVVAAYDPARPGGGFPASHPGVFAVAADSSSNPPRAIHLAPGNAIPTTQAGGQWILVNGNSFAAAHVSGLLALVRSRNISAKPFLPRLWTESRGFIDGCATLLQSDAARDCPHNEPKARSR